MNRPQLPPANGPGCRAAQVCLAALLAGSAAAQTVELRQTSVPVGIVNQTTTVTINTVAATVAAPETSGGYSFCYWTLNTSRWADPGGYAQNPAYFTVLGAVDAVAVYIPTSDDTDSDSLPDWWEYRCLGTLSWNAGDNPDGDAYSNAEELTRGLLPGVHNLPDHGGVSRRRWIASVIQDPAHYVYLTELSQPVGVIQQTRIVPKGTPVTLATPPGSTGGYSFTGWTVNGARFDTPADNQPITVTPTADLTLVARYTPTDQDSDADGLLDWKEWLWFDGLQFNNSSDPDGDGFTIAEEELRGFASFVANELAHGGISRRRATAIYADTTGRLPYRLASDPATILDSTAYQPAGSVVTVPDKTGHTYGSYQFCWWDLNGLRQQDASGAALGGFNFTLNTPSVATAHYIDPNIDSDGDGIKDWNELTYFGSLMYDTSSDPDGDSFTYAEELARNQVPQTADVLDYGGISRRRADAIFGSTVGHLPLITISNPVSILDNRQFLLPGTPVTIADKTGHTYANLQFSWWDRNGVRQEDASGAALGGLGFTLTVATTLTGNYIDPTLDTDGDGIKDWHEWTYYGTLANDPNSDSDNDGYTYAAELARSQSPRAVDTMEHGGISRRRCWSFIIDPVLVAGPPEIGELQATNITNTTATINARINALGSATTANFEYGTSPAFGQTVASVSIVNGFIADSMSAPLQGLLPGTLYYYRVNATNTNGTSTGTTATFRTTGTLTNYQQWALIYSITDTHGDEDHDGAENLLEYAFGMNPRLGTDIWKLPAPKLIDGRLWLAVFAPPDVDDVTYGAQYSTALTDWIALTDTGLGTYHEFWTPPHLVGSPKVFVRWKIVLH